MGSGAAKVLIFLLIVVLALYAIREYRDLNTPTTAANPPAQTNSQPQTNIQQPVQNQPQTSSRSDNGGVSSGDSSTTGTSSGNSSVTTDNNTSTTHTYYWMGGDIIGQHATCEFAISQPDQPLDIQPAGDVAQGSFTASSDAEYQAKKQHEQEIIGRTAPNGCPDYTGS